MKAPEKQENSKLPRNSGSPIGFLINRLTNLYQAYCGSSISDKELAAHFDVNTSTLSRWKNGEVEPDGVDFLLRLLTQVSYFRQSVFTQEV